MKRWVVDKYSVDTWKLFLRAGGFELENKPIETDVAKIDIRGVVNK